MEILSTFQYSSGTLLFPQTFPNTIPQDRLTCVQDRAGKLPTRSFPVRVFGISGITPQFCFAKAVIFNTDKWAQLCANKTLL